MAIGTLQQVNQDFEHRGLMEILFVLLVLLVVGTYSLNIYKDYVQKAKFTEIFNAVIDFKVILHEYYATKHRFPDTRAMKEYFSGVEAFSPKAGSGVIISDMSFEEGVLSLKFLSDRKDIDGTFLTFEALTNSKMGSIVWLCGYAFAPEGLDSNYFGKMNLRARSKTTLPKEYLPRICRG